MSTATHFWVTLLLGVFGVHKFVDKKTGWGVLYLLTFGLCGIGWIVDTVKAAIPYFSQCSTQRAAVPASAAPRVEPHAAGEPIVEQFDAVGTTYHTEEIGKLASCNPDWKSTGKALVNAGKAGQRIYRYSYINKPVKLVPEPQNPHDKNAVAVYIAGELVAYISQDDNVHVKDILTHRTVRYISGFIGGGQYKVAAADGTLSHEETNLFVSIKISYS